MFSEIDKTIFSDECKVLEIVPYQHYVFPIFKCGRSSLYESVADKNWKVFTNEDIGTIKSPITVFLRSPKNRFISGVNTFVQQTLRTNPGLDEDTIMWFVNNYLFLNRHYCPQFFWLANLSRYCDPGVKLKLEDYQKVSTLTERHLDAGITKPTPEFLKKIANFDWQRIRLYLYLDQILVDRIGQEFTFAELVDIVKQQYPNTYQLVFERSQKLINHVLPST